MTGAAVSVKRSEIGGDLDHAVGETPFVVVPGQHADKALVEDLGLGHIEGRAVRVVVEIDRDGRRPVYAEDALEPVRLRGIFHQRVDFIGDGLVRRVEGQVNQRDIGRRNPDRGAVELAFERRQDQADRPCRSGRGRDHRLRRATSAPQVAVQGVLEALVAGIGVYRCHETAIDADALMQHIRDRRQAVGRARAVGNNLMLGFEGLLVDAHHDSHVGAIGRSRNNDFLRTSFEVLCGSVALGENAGAFKRHIDPEFSPREFGRVALGGNADLAATRIHPILAGGHLAGEAPVHTVVSEQMRIGFDRAEIVDADDLNFFGGMLQSRAHDQAADPAKPVDRNPYRHGLFSRNSWPIYRSERAACATFSGVMPKCGKSSSPGADAPKPVMPIKAPRGPSQRSQPNWTAASTATRGAEPRTALWYSSGACSKSSQHGIDTTAARTPSLASASRAAIATETSEPVASRVTWRRPSASRST